MARCVLVLFCLALVSAQGTVQDGVRGGGTVFKKCGGILFGGKDRCFEVVLSSFQVQMGSDGTDDIVMVKVCSDDQKTCCTTPSLKKSFHDDWSSNDLEQWNEDKLGTCKGKKFSIKRGLDVTILKEGTDSLAITSFFIEAEGVSSLSGQTSPERFDCGGFSVTDVRSGRSETNSCRTSPYSYERIKQINVAIGPDGTDDDVRAEFCSDVDSVCCRTRLHSMWSDDWSKNDDEVWAESELGDCETVLYKVKSGLRITLLKNGKDDLVVNKLTVDTESIGGAAYMYDCHGFNLVSQGQQCVEGVTCRHEKLCSKTTLGGASTTSRLGLLSQVAGVLSGPTTHTHKTTGRPPFRG